MPDQSSAASEHAILQEITVPLEHLPDDPVAAVHADFPIALRGYDRIAVDDYVHRTSQLVAELQSTRSPDAAIKRALERLGEQISGILQRAHDTAEQITTQSRAEAEDRLQAAREEAVQITAAAEQRVRDLDADTDRIWAERHRIVDDTKELARQLVVLADSAAERFPPAEEPEAEADRAVPVYDVDAPRLDEDSGRIGAEEPIDEPVESEATAAFTPPGVDELDDAQETTPFASDIYEPPPHIDDTDATAAFTPPDFDEEPSVEVRSYDDDPAFPPSTPGGTWGSARK